MKVTRIRKALIAGVLAMAGATMIVAPNNAAHVPAPVPSEHPFPGTTTTTDPVSEATIPTDRVD